MMALAALAVVAVAVVAVAAAAAAAVAVLPHQVVVVKATEMIARTILTLQRHFRL